MPSIKIFNPSSGKDERMTDRQIQNRTKKSVNWFRDSLKNQFGKPKTRAAQSAQGELESTTRQTKGRAPTKAERAQANRQKADQFTNSNTTLDKTFKQNVRTVKTPEIGRLYMYVYDPKHKDTLPYYDVFPMVFITDFYPDGFLGMNVHYLPYLLRAKLMEALLKHQKQVTRKGKREQYLDISYAILKAAATSKYFKPTIKRYLFDHVRSPFAEVQEPEWENALFLPVEQFRKKSKREVWSDSRSEVK